MYTGLLQKIKHKYGILIRTNANTLLVVLSLLRFIDAKVIVNTLKNTSIPVLLLGQIVHLFFYFALLRYAEGDRPTTFLKIREK